MALTEIPERRGRTRQPSEWGTVIMHTRVFSCPKGEVAAVLAGSAELSKGSALPTKWGGDAGTTAISAKLQTIAEGQQKGGGLQEIVAVWEEFEART